MKQTDKFRLTNLFGYTSLAIIIAFLAAIAFLVAKAGFKNISNTNAFISAFSGAFFAFIFVRLTELLSRLYLRERMNQEALVESEHLTQEYINKLYNNDFVADDISKTIDKNKSVTTINSLIKVNFNFFKPVPIDTKYIDKLRNIDYKNDLLNFYADLEKVNGGMQAVQRYYDLLTTHLMTGQLAPDTYVRNLLVIKDIIDELKQFLASSIEDCVAIAAKTRLLLRENSIMFVSAIRLKPQNYSEGFDKKVVVEIKVVKEEMDENTEASLAKIKKTITSKDSN